MTMEHITLGGGEHSNEQRENWTTICQICFDLDSCTEQEVGLSGLISCLQLNYSIILWDTNHIHTKQTQKDWLTAKQKGKQPSQGFEVI